MTVSAADEAGVIAGDVSLPLAPSSSSACSPPRLSSPAAARAISCSYTQRLSIQVYLSVDAVAAAGSPGARATPLSYPRPPRTATRRTTAPWTPHVGRRGVLSAPRAGRGPAGGAARAARGGGGPRHGAELEGAPALSMVWAVTAGDAGKGGPVRKRVEGSGGGGGGGVGWDSVQVRLGRRCRRAPARHFPVAFVLF